MDVGTGKHGGKEQCWKRGIAVLWRRGVDVILRNFSDNHIDVDVMEADGARWRFTGVYGFPQTEAKHRIWTLLQDLHLQDELHLPWLCAGDFNEILFQHEKEGGCVRPQAQIDRFREAIEFCELQDLGFEGDVFTWRNHQSRMEDMLGKGWTEL